MDNEWNQQEEMTPLPEHTNYPEFTPEYPDVTFFKESFVTMMEENIFQGEIPEGEGEGAGTEQDLKEKREKQRSRLSWLRNFLGSAMRAGAAVFAVTALIVNATTMTDAASGSWPEKIQSIVRGLKEDAFTINKEDYSADELYALWNADPEAPHQYDYDHLIVLKEATCTENGIAGYVCKECGVILTHNTTKPHEAADAVQEKRVEPDCTHEGSYEEAVYCKVCGKELSRTLCTIPALGHTGKEPVIENTVEPSCTEDGSQEEVVYCEVCGEEVSRTTVVLKATGHTEGEAVVENEVEALCEEDGHFDSVVYCAVCGEELSRETTVLAALGHTEAEAVREDEVSANCTAEGHYDTVVYCEFCGEELSRETTVLAALGHSYTTRTVAPTCTAQGYTTHTCSRCGSSYNDGYRSALGHSYTTSTVAPTCTAQGYTTHRCTRCGTSYTDNPKAALGHSFSIYQWEEELTCSRCGTAAMTLTYNRGSNVFSYSMNSEFYSQIKSGFGGRLYVEAGPEQILTPETESWNSSGTLEGVEVRDYFDSGETFACHLVFMYWNDNNEYCAVSPVITATAP